MWLAPLPERRKSRFAVSRFSVLAAACFWVSAVAGVAQDLTDDHLKVIPRTSVDAARVHAVTRPTRYFDRPEAFEENPAGAGSVRAKHTADAFSSASGNISFGGELDFKVGNGIFRKIWVSSPSSTLASDGLGPLYNARSCQRCHIKDGRGHAPRVDDENAVSLLMRISIPSNPTVQMQQIEGYLARAADPVYGGQIQDVGLAGHKAEAQISVRYTEFDVPLAGDEVVTLRQPDFTVTNLGYGPVHPEAGLSARVAPQMIGLGLLEAIPAADILAGADAADEDGDGISGRPNIVWSREFNKPMLGRFGLKAGMPTLREQSAAAFSGDIGISTSIFPDPFGDCTGAQIACRTAPHGDGDARVYELDDATLDLVTFYSRNLGVPKRRDISKPDVLRGKEVFYKVGCIACHTPKFVTHRLDGQAEQSFQLIWPYTDMLLHDMGDGLADRVPEGRALGREWRTPPLWGIGLTQAVSGHTEFLHDGRARSLLEAIVWHGGEAKAARDRVVGLSPPDRAALIKFLESL